MPYLTSLSIRISRKFQIERDDWLGVDVLATVAIEESEAHLVDPADIRRLAREQAKAALSEQIADELAERAERRQQHTEAGNGTHSNGHVAPPQTVEEAEQRFYTRWGDVIGGDSWVAVQRYTGIQPQPTTIKAWYAVAEAVHRKAT